MADIFFPFDAGAGAAVQESQWSKMARYWLGDGVLRGYLNLLAAFGDNTGMQIKVPSGAAWAAGIYYENTAQVTMAVTSAHATLPRIDRLVVRVDWVANSASLVVKAGTPGAVPVEPTLTQTLGTTWEIPIARIDVAAATASITAANVTDERVWASSIQTPEANLSINGPVAAISQQRTGSVTSNHSLIAGAQGVSNQYGLYNNVAARYEWYVTAAGIFTVPLGIVVNAGGANVTGGVTVTTGNLSLVANNAYVAFRSAGVQTWAIGDGIGASNGVLSFYDMVNSAIRMTLTSAGILTAFGGLQVSSGGAAITGAVNSFSAGTNLSTVVTVGSSGVATTTAKAASLILDPPSAAGTLLGTANVILRRAGTNVWEFGIDATTVSGGKGTATDLYFYANGVGYVASLSSGGVFKVAADNLSFYSVAPTGTTGNYSAWTNGGGNMYVGLDNSGGGQLGTASLPYYGIVKCPSGFSLLTNTSVYAMTVVGTGGVSIYQGLTVSGGLSVVTGGFVVVNSTTFTYTNTVNSPTQIVVTNASTGVSAYAGIHLVGNPCTLLIGSASSGYGAPYTSKGFLQSNSSAGMMFQNVNNGPIQFYVGAGTTLGAQVVASGQFQALNSISAANGITVTTGGLAILAGGFSVNAGAINFAAGTSITFGAQLNIPGDMTNHHIRLSSYSGLQGIAGSAQLLLSSNSYFDGSVHRSVTTYPSVQIYMAAATLYIQTCNTNTPAGTTITWFNSIVVQPGGYVEIPFLMLSGGANQLWNTLATLTNYAGGSAATLGNSPVAGNPSKWVKFQDANVARYIPTWS